MVNLVSVCTAHAAALMAMLPASVDAIQRSRPVGDGLTRALQQAAGESGIPGGTAARFVAVRSPVLAAMGSKTADQQRITVTGTRISEGNAVDCPKIRGDNGKIYSVSYLAPSIAIGDRVSVTGFIANVVSCLGPVLNVEDVTVLEGR